MSVHKYCKRLYFSDSDSEDFIYPRGAIALRQLNKIDSQVVKIR